MLITLVKYYPKTYKYYSLFPNKDSDNEDMIKKREKMKQKIKFFLNNKKNKSSNKEIKEKDIDNNIEDKDEENKSGENNSENNNEEEKESEEEKNIKEKHKEKIKKEKKEKDNNRNIQGQNDYESFKKKKVFKDSFFELDE